MKLHIKNMVSLRCKMVVCNELQKLGIPYSSVELGSAETLGNVTPPQYKQLKDILSVWGLELLGDKKEILVEKIRKEIIEMIHHADEPPKINYSDYLSQRLNYDYTYLSNVFSEVKGMSIQQFIMLNKIEKVKELLLDEELNLTEISYRLYYSSVAHLSTQFKKVTGFSPTFFKQSNQSCRMQLECI